MKVQEMMTRQVRFCQANADLATAALMMWDGDCGVIPVVDDRQHVIAVITDRDICMAVATQHKRADDILVRDIKSESPLTCFADDDAAKVLKIMRTKKIRRVPVTDHEGRLVGIVSLNDFALAVGNRKADAPPATDVLHALKSICEHRPAAMVA